MWECFFLAHHSRCRRCHHCSCFTRRMHLTKIWIPNHQIEEKITSSVGSKCNGIHRDSSYCENDFILWTPFDVHVCDSALCLVYCSFFLFVDIFSLNFSYSSHESLTCLTQTEHRLIGAKNKTTRLHNFQCYYIFSLCAVFIRFYSLLFSYRSRRTSTTFHI